MRKFKIKKCCGFGHFDKCVKDTVDYKDSLDSPLIMGLVRLKPEFFNKEMCEEYGSHPQVQLLNRREETLMPVNFCPTCGVRIKIEEVTNIVEK